MKYKTLVNMKMHGETLAAGAEIELTEAEAANLLKATLNKPRIFKIQITKHA